MKIHSPQITHKTDVGGVKLNLASDEAVAEAFTKMVERAKQAKPDATILGVTIQKMVAVPNAFELIMGMKKDPVFGAVILVGMGGISAEVFKDRALALPPLNETLARRALESLKSWPLLKGYRGKPAANIDKLIETLMRFSYLVADYPEISELDVNPLLVTPDDVIALDARVVIDQTSPSTRCGGSGIWRSGHILRNMSPSGISKTARRSFSGLSSPKTSRCGTNCWQAARKSRSATASVR